MRAAIAACLAMACSGSESPGDSAAPLGACEGAGEPSLALGSGGLSTFAAWEDGDTVVIEADGGGRYGFYADLLTEGIDTTATTTVFVRFSIGDDPTTRDVGATLTLQCPNEGPGWFGLFVTLDDSEQDAAVVATLIGQPMHLTATITDQAEDSASVTLDLVVGE